MTKTEVDLLINLISWNRNAAAHVAQHGIVPPTWKARIEEIEAELRALATADPIPKAVITAEMVRALRDRVDVSLQAAKDALTACNGDQAAAEEWIRTHRWPR